MLTSKQRARLRGLASTEDTILHIGKSGVSDTLVTQTIDTLKARELIKGKVLDNSGYNAKEAAEELAEKTGADIVTVIGNKFVLFKRNAQNPVVALTDKKPKPAAVKKVLSKAAKYKLMAAKVAKAAKYNAPVSKGSKKYRTAKPKGYKKG